MKIFFDLDGVLANFIGGVERLFDVQLQADWRNTHPGVRDVVPLLSADPRYNSITDDEFWKKIDECPFFWDSLGEYVDGMETFWLVHNLVGSDNIYFASSPSRHHSCHGGKAKWVRDHFNDFLSSRLILTKHKQLLAGPNRLLIDDSDKNVYWWRVTGGEAILFPRPWNSGYEFCDKAGAIVLGQLRNAIGVKKAIGNTTPTVA